MPWKNGLGVTTELAIFPEGSLLERGDFIWRLSTARVEADNRFSQFIGYQRKLAILQGDGLILNDTSLKPLNIFSFAGEETIHCQIVGKVVDDIGVIFKRGLCDCEMDIKEISTTIEWEPGTGTHFLVPLDSPIRYDKNILNRGDYIRITDTPKIALNPAETDLAHALCISIWV